MTSLHIAIALVLGLQAAPQGPSSGAAEAQTGAAILSQVYEHWRVDCEAPGVRALRIVFDVTIDANGEIVGHPAPVRAQDTPVYRAAADAALRALLTSAPFDVPEGYTGGEFRAAFNLARVCGGTDQS
ncbi:MAG: hypothetical protein HYU62_00510 [Caulobacterales bacterium]|nr:hypothetical protein [Caulobacterales bacterium]